MPGIEKIRGRHLEKKKDWIRRTRDYQQKAKTIKHLKAQARERNPNEFDFHMLRSQVGLDGVHRDMDSEDEEQTEVQKLLSDVTDIKYVRYHLNNEKKKIEKLKSVLHFCADKIGGGEGEAASSTSVNRPVNKHIIFVRNIKQAKSFDLLKHFGTSEQFIGRRFNRPKVREEEKVIIVESSKTAEITETNKNDVVEEEEEEDEEEENSKTYSEEECDEEVEEDMEEKKVVDEEGEQEEQHSKAAQLLKDSEKERRRLYAELGKRMQRAKELAVVLAKLELKRDLQLAKGSELKPKRVLKGDAQRAAVYKWTYERKK